MVTPQPTFKAEEEETPDLKGRSQLVFGTLGDLPSAARPETEKQDAKNASVNEIAHTVWDESDSRTESGAAVSMAATPIEECTCVGEDHHQSLCFIF